MSTNSINRTNDEEIIDIMNSVLSNGNMQVETFNEAILVKLMELRGTPIKDSKKLRNIDEFKEQMKDVYSTSVLTETLDEVPNAYKPIKEIFEAIKDTADVIDIIKPIYNFKAH